ncbi:MAG TPA: hypothetical protein VKZ50_01450 [bacterium]|nr:hypothetical protein [bacterium]
MKLRGRFVGLVALVAFVGTWFVSSLVPQALAQVYPPPWVQTSNGYQFMYSTIFSNVDPRGNAITHNFVTGSQVIMNGTWSGANAPITLAGNNTFTGTNTFNGTTNLAGTTTVTGSSLTINGGLPNSQLAGNLVSQVNVTTTSAGAQPSITNPSGVGPSTLSLSLTLPQIVLGKGTGAGTYSTANVFGTEVGTMSQTITVPLGAKLTVSIAFNWEQLTAPAACAYQLWDTPSVLAYQTNDNPSAASDPLPSAMQSVVVGDGAPHTIQFAFSTSNAADACAVMNTTNSQVPQMILRLEPAN